MKVLRTIKELQDELGKLALKPIGFVPTMGALHEGHLSLVAAASAKCPVVVVSIYVNPTQFNDKEDLRNYPRTPEADLALLQVVMRSHDIVFTPSDKEIYPEEDTRKFRFGNLDRVMEALHRPGHFNGVAKVVSRLFDIVRPDIAIFGMKDFQQLAVIKELVRQTGNRVIIEGSPIIRENDGLAMSSRNRLLGSGIRANASVIYSTLKEAASMIPEHDLPEINSFVHSTINSVPGFSVEYFDIADDTELIPVYSKSGLNPGKRYFGCIAVNAGAVRLIDNIEIGLV
jgi:pantoate--beta-alanine ligase